MNKFYDILSRNVVGPAAPRFYLIDFHCSIRWFVPLLVAVLWFPFLAMAAAPTADTQVGDMVTNPVTGEDVEVVSLLQGSDDGKTYAVVTDDNSLIFTIVNVGDILPDPDGDWTVDSVQTNGTTGLVDEVSMSRKVPDPDDSNKTITEDKVLGVVSDYSEDAADAADAAAGAPSSPAAELDPPTVPDGNTNWVYKVLLGSNGGDGRDGYGVEICDPTGILGCYTIEYEPKEGEDGGTGPAINLVVGPSNGNIETITDDLCGIKAVSRGGNGGQGGDAYGNIDAAAGGDAGAGGTVTVTNQVDISTSGDGAHGIFAQSRSGKAGDGGDGYIASSGGSGGTASKGGTVTVTNEGTIKTTGDGSHGIFAQSIGGSAGDGGDSWGIVGIGGSSTVGGNGGTVSVTNEGVIYTEGKASHGVFAQSLGGTGGDGGDAGGIVSLGGTGSAGGNGGRVTVTNADGAFISTTGKGSHGILAQSIGGGGGNGGIGAGIVGLGADGAGGGNGSSVTVNNGVDSDIYTTGNGASAILAQSIGGGGGNGGIGAGLVGLGAEGSGGGNGGTVRVTTDAGGVLSTTGNDSHALMAQSIGGGGGTGGSAGGLVVLGGQGSGGGNGGSVTINNGADIYTEGLRSRGIYAQSIGGGGGNGAGAGGGVSLGGEGSGGGNGGTVTVTNTGIIKTQGDDSDAIFAQSVGGGGGSGGASGGLVSLGGSGGGGGDGNAVTVNNAGTLQTFGDRSKGIFAQSIGGGGGNGGGTGGVVSLGGSSDDGGDSGAVQIENSGSVTTWGAKSDAIFAQSVGGGGGNGGGSGGVVSLGGSGSAGGDADSVTVHNSGQLSTAGDSSRGIFAQSVGGGGGNGSGSGGLVSLGGSAGAASHGSTVTVQNSGNIATAGVYADAIFAQSVGGGGGNGAGSGGGVSLGGDGGSGGNGSAVSVENSGYLFTSGDDSRGIFAQSVGGGGGNGAGSGGLVSLGGGGGSAGSAGNVQVTNTGEIITQGDRSDAIFAQSVGGGGGNGAGSGGVVSLGGDGDGGGSAGSVTITNQAALTTSGDDSRGIFAQSVGGGGGNGSGSGGLVSLGGSAGTASHGSTVTVQNSGAITTGGDRSDAIFAQSVGGGGGNGGTSGGMVTLGGSGGAGGDGGAVVVDNSGVLGTDGDESSGIFAQSVGGGGGNGGNSIGVGAFISVSLGGSGGDGGDGAGVQVTNTGDLISTSGNSSYGILAQSVGGGGGNGGFAVSTAVGYKGSVSFGLGGSGGNGGVGGSVSVAQTGDIVTLGDDAHGIFAQSIGGGGGSGGFSIAASISDGVAGSLSIGGSGGDGGNAGTVTLTSSGNIGTCGDHAYGILAQSVGGGGGDGGFSITGSLGLSGSVGLGFGGSGGSGGDAGAVTVNSDSAVTTLGNDAHGIVAQSIGGGGGSGGFSVAGSLGTQAAIGVSFGGSGGTGGNGDVVTLESHGDIATSDDRSYGLLAQSIGGGGGAGGFSVAGGISNSASISFGLGGSGGTAGDGSSVTLLSTGNVTTEGDDAHAIVAQSIGGGGGTGGFSVAGGISAQGVAIAAGIGGSGGGGGTAGDVTLTSNGSIIATYGDRSYGILAQSVGGGGGDGGFSIAGGLSKTAALTFGLGGTGGTGNDAGAVTVLNNSNIYTEGLMSYALVAQSLGGGGGTGGFSVAGSLSTNSGGLSASIGGSGEGGGDGGVVTVTNNGSLQTLGDGAHAILAQSIGGGGGSGGFSGSFTGGFGDGASLSLAVGGSGEDGGDADSVTVANNGTILTEGDAAYGIYAQSIGGGGGDGGGSLAVALGKDEKSVSLAVAIGGGGGDGGKGGDVTVENSGMIYTYGDESDGIVAQSIGGGGGNGGFSMTGSLNSGTGSKQLSVSIGGSGGSGGTAADVTVINSGSIYTDGDAARGIVAQSIGGSGGNGGFSFTGSFGSGDSKNIGVSIGGGGGDGNAAGNVYVENAEGASIETSGEYSYGILAQSIGGGGGTGGSSVAVAFGTGGSNQNINMSIGIGGGGGDGGTGGNVEVINRSSILTDGSGSHGIFAQSIGGGGGAGGSSLAAVLGLNATSSGKTLNLGVSIGGAGGDGNDGGEVTVINEGRIDTYGNDSHGIFAQSIGGGGGVGGSAGTINFVLGTGSNTGGANKALSLSVGGSGGGASDGGLVSVTNSGDIVTRGAESHGIFAQSVGGGGGVGGQAEYGLSSLPGEDEIDDIEAAVGGTVGLVYGQTKIWNDLSIALGGSGGSSGDGGLVVVNNSGNIATTGDGSSGIMAQSIGGGGGIGGLAAIGLTGKLGIGGEAGASGNGGDVDITHSGYVYTYGAASYGIFAQSVGGGGGVAGDVEQCLADYLNIGLGLTFARDGGGGGDGGTVNVTSSGDIVTAGEGSTAIFAQSIGGGGGLGGSVGYTGTFLGFGGSVGDAGDGGTVTVDHSGSILTQADDSHGIYAQSEGGEGSGGYVSVHVSGDIGTQGDDSTGIVALSRGGDGADDIEVSLTGSVSTEGVTSRGVAAQSHGGTGYSGDIDVNVGGNVDTTGESATGVYAQTTGDDGSGNITVSVGGRVTTQGDGANGVHAVTTSDDGASGSIQISVAGDVIAAGADADGIYAESSGDSGQGNININLSGDYVLGGTGTGAGVHFVGGATNTLRVSGLLASLDGLTGTAVLGTSGDETVHSYGTVVGNVDLGSGSNAFYNYTEAILLSGSTFYLNAGGLLSNDGWLAPGDSDNVLTTTLTGNFIQSQGGIYFVDLDFNGNLADRITGSGWAQFAGQVTLNTMNSANLLPGYHTIVIVSGNGGVSTGEMTLNVQPSAVVDYALIQPDAKSLALGVDIDFSPAGLNRNQTSIGDCFNRIQLAGGSDAMGPVITALFNLPDTQSLATTYDSMSPEPYDHLTTTALEVSRRYILSLMQRMHSLRLSGQAPGSANRAKSRPILLAYNGSDAGLGQLFDKPEPDKYGLWFNGFGQIGEQSAGGGYDGYDFDTLGFSTGFDRRFRRDFLAGISFGYSQSSLEIQHNQGAADLKNYQVSLYGSYYKDRFYIDGIASYGRQDYENVRVVQIDTDAWLSRSDHEGDSWSVYGETGLNFTSGPWYIQPFFALNYLRLDEEGFDESGAGALSLHIDRRSTDALMSDLGSRVGGTYETSAGVFGAELSVAWNYDFDLDDRMITASFAGYPGASFSFKGREPQNHGIVYGVGFNFVGNGGFSSSLKYNQELRNGFRTQGVMGEVRYAF